MKLEVGDIIFYKSTTLIGKVIDKLTDSEYSHVAMYVGDNKIIEANRFIKSRIVEMHVLDGQLHKVRRLKKGLDLKQKTIMKASLPHVLNKPYDYPSIWVLFLKLAFNIDSKNIVNDLNAFFCSELIDYFYLLVGEDIVPEVEGHVVTPHDLEVSPEMYDVDIT